MAPESRPPRRPVVGSRNPTARPRRIAGRGEDAGPAALTEVVEPPPTPHAPVSKTPKTPKTPKTSTPGLLSRTATTLALVVALVLLAGIAAGESWYLWGQHAPVVSAARPVVTDQMAYRVAVDTASRDTEQILSTSYKDYDAQVDQATATMTDSFAAEYRKTVEDIKPQFLSSKTELQVKVVGAGVVRASSAQVQALLFLNQFVTKAGTHADATPYRALVTMVHTDHGWLVSNIETQ